MNKTVTQWIKKNRNILTQLWAETIVDHPEILREMDFYDFCVETWSYLP